jgi:acyl-CoA synthetase (AMP-forming)/AMP-acid ligase II
VNLTLPIHRHALRHPSKLALVSARQRLSYRELDQLLWSGAAYLRSQGLGPTDRAILLIADPLLHLLAGLALARLGVAYFAAARSDGRALIDATGQRLAPRALVCEPDTPGLPDCSRIVLDRGAFSGRSTAPSNLFSEAPDQTWRFVTSSGTTGRPKPFAISHALVAKRVRRRQLAVPMAASDVFLSLPNAAFLATASRNLEVLTLGGTVAIAAEHPRAAEIGDLCAKAGVNRAFVVPATLRSALDSPAGTAALYRLPVLETGAGVLPMSLRKETMQRLSSGLHLTYATNETSCLAAAAGHGLGAAADTVGYPLPRGDFEIVDDADAAVGQDAVGHVRARNDSAVSGYYDDAEADRRFFRGGWFYPGDLACWSADGQVIFKGRADDMMIVDGINIYPVEIENLLQEHPCVREAIAFPLRSQRHGDVPAAAVRVSAAVTDSELIGFARERLGVRSPRRVMIVADFPRNALGKPLKREMAKFLKQAVEK